MSRRVPLRWIPAAVAVVLSAQASALDRAADVGKAPTMWGYGVTGSGVEVAVVDVFAAEGTHPDLADNYLAP